MTTSPASRTVFPPDAFGPGATILTLIGAVVLLFAIFIVGGIGWVVVHGADLGTLTRSLSSLFGIELQSAAEIAVIIYLAILVPAIGKCTLRDLGFRTPAPEDAATTLIGIITMFAVVTILGTILTNVLHVKGQEMAVQVFLRMYGWQKVAFALFGVVVGPIFEEFFFRVFLFNAMRKWWRFWPAAIVSGILFGLAHSQPGNAALLISLITPLAAGGIILAYVYARTGNAWTNMITHGAFNALSLLLIAVAPQLAK